MKRAPVGALLVVGVLAVAGGGATVLLAITLAVVVSVVRVVLWLAQRDTT